MLSDDPIEPIEPVDPMLPIEAKDPTLNIDRADPREALHSAADQAPEPEHTMTRISARLGARPVRRRRTGVLVVAVTVVVIALAIILPSVLVNRTGVPADQRVAGHWNLIHRVNPPGGWVERDRWVQTDREGRLLAPSDAPDYATETCRVEIFGRGVLTDPVPADTPSVDINGRPGFAVSANQQGLAPYGIYWLYADNAWASVSCIEEGTTRALDIARRTVFEPEPLTSGLRLRRLPGGYAGNAILQSTVHGQPVSALTLKATDQGAEPSRITITVTPGPTTVPPGTPDYEEDRIAGRPAWHRHAGPRTEPTSGDAGVDADPAVERLRVPRTGNGEPR